MGDGIEKSDATPKSLKEIFDEVFPYYLSLGMTYDQFFNDRVELVIAYRKADKLRNKRINQQMWLQGIYVRYALASTVGNMFIKSKQDAVNYPEKPLPLTLEEHMDEKLEKEKEKFELMKKKMEIMSTNINKKMKGVGD